MATRLALLACAVACVALLAVIAVRQPRSAPPPLQFPELKRDLLELRHATASGHMYGHYVMPGPFSVALVNLETDYRVQQPKPNTNACEQIEGVIANARILRATRSDCPWSVFQASRTNVICSAADAVEALEASEHP